jgi:hypothetical protein
MCQLPTAAVVQACAALTNLEKESLIDVWLGGKCFPYFPVVMTQEGTAVIDTMTPAMTDLPKKDVLEEPQGKACVKFHDPISKIYEITPCSEIYGMHPREFVFDKFYFMLPADGVTDIGAAWKRRNFIEEEDSDGDSDEDLLADDWEHEYTM